jgi:hypothetical protein
MNPIWPMVNQRICDIYGLDPKEVRSVSLYMNPHEIPTVVVRLHANEGVALLTLDILNGKVLQ